MNRWKELEQLTNVGVNKIDFFFIIFYKNIRSFVEGPVPVTMEKKHSKKTSKKNPKKVKDFRYYTTQEGVAHALKKTEKHKNEYPTEHAEEVKKVCDDLGLDIDIDSLKHALYFSTKSNAICGYCYKIEGITKMCGGCKIKYYCTREHQMADWSKHKKTCFGAIKEKEKEKEKKSK